MAKRVEFEGVGEEAGKARPLAHYATRQREQMMPESEEGEDEIMQQRQVHLDEEEREQRDEKADALPSMEDITYKSFHEQDERWGGAQVDARQHISHREAHAEYRFELTGAISRYQVIEDWVMLIHCTRSNDKTPDRLSSLSKDLLTLYMRLSTLNQDVVRIIAEFRFGGGYGAVADMLGHNLLQSFLLHDRYRRQQLQQKEHEQQQQQQQASGAQQPFFIYLRKRPLLPYELQAGGFNAVDVNTYELDSTAGGDSGVTGAGGQPFSNLVTVHDGKLARNGRLLQMKHRVFAVSESFSEHVSNEEMCLTAVEPLVGKVLLGLPATILFYGQTGTGKTHSLLGALQFIAQRLAGQDISLTFYEIRGKKSFDLLNDRARVHLRSDQNEHVHVRGCREVRFSQLEPGALMRVLDGALANRSSKVTERNPVSSRSHAICSISVTTTTGSKSSTSKVSTRMCGMATLRLVDLAGSERNYDTSGFTADDHRESADINMALMALKDCFRAYNASCGDKQAAPGGEPPLRAPYRASLLTRILRECFIREMHHITSVIATVSPSPADIEHTLNTLEHVTMMDPALDALPIARCVAVDVMIDGCAPPDSPIDTWTHRQVLAWLSHADGGKFSQLVLPAGMTGQALLKLNVNSLTALCAGQLREAREDGEGSAWVEEGESTKGQVLIAKRLFSLLRREQNACLVRQMTKAAN